MRDRLTERWGRLCASLGASDVDAVVAAFDSIAAAYATPPRAYHNLDHVADCLKTLDRCVVAAEDRSALEFALWLHDAVYVPGAKDNEDRSADLAELIARSVVRDADQLVATTRMLILATTHAGAAGTLTGDVALIADIDLAILAAPAPQYNAYTVAIRAEFANIDTARFNAGRAALIESMLQREWLYATARFRDECEDGARRNLRRELGRLRADGDLARS